MQTLAESDREKREWCDWMRGRGMSDVELERYLPPSDRYDVEDDAGDPAPAFRSFLGDYAIADRRILAAVAPFARRAHARGIEYRARINGRVVPIRPEDLPPDDGRGFGDVSRYSPRAAYRQAR
jgi:hypothetical protein